MVEKCRRVYAADFNDEVKRKPPPKDKIEWNDQKTSDHDPVFAACDKVGRVFDYEDSEVQLYLISWNLLNSVWMEWLAKGGEDGPHLDNHRMVDVKNNESRLLQQLQRLGTMVKKSIEKCVIVFLQEVSPLMLFAIQKMFKDDFHLLYYATNDSLNNFNVTLFPHNHVTFFYQYNPIRSDALGQFEKKNRTVALYQIKFNETGETMIVANVHLDYGTNKQFADAILQESSAQQCRILVGGDFNAYLRTPSVGDGDHIIDVCTKTRDSSSFLIFLTSTTSISLRTPWTKMWLGLKTEVFFRCMNGVTILC